MAEENKNYWTPLHVYQKSELDLYKEIHRVENENKERVGKVDTELKSVKNEVKNVKTELYNLNISQKEGIKEQKESNAHLKELVLSFNDMKNWSTQIDNKVEGQESRLSKIETSIVEKTKANTGVIVAVIGAFATICAAAFGFASAFFN